MANGTIEKAFRLRLIEKWIFEGRSRKFMSDKLGIRPETISRYLQARRKAITDELENQRLIVRQQLLMQGATDAAKLQALIADLETSERPNPLAITQAYSVRNQIRRSLARLVDAESPMRHLHVHANHSDSRYSPGQPVQAGGVNISFEAFDGGDPEFEPAHRTAKPIDVEAQTVGNGDDNGRQ
jgi:hypothetical protein